MKLRTKLLLGVGILLFAMVITMYILPAFLVRRDVYKAAEDIHALLIEDHRQLIRSQQVWLKDVVANTKQNIDAILFMIYEEENFSDKLTFGPNNSLVNVWDGIATIVGYDPEIGFIQAHSPSENKAAVLIPHAANLYPLRSFSREENLALVSLQPPSGENPEDYVFVAVSLPKKLQSEPGYTLFALLGLDDIKEEKEVVKEEISHLTPAVIHRHLAEVKDITLDQTQAQPTAYYWATKIDMIRTLTPLVVEGLMLQEGKTRKVPEGIARVDSSGNGFALLTNEFLKTEPLFDDKLYYELHLPTEDDPPLADGTMVVTEKRGDHAFIGNTLRLDSTFLSIGNPLASLVQQLALSSHKMILMGIDDDFWIGFDENGNKLTQEKIAAILQTGILKKQRGIISFGKNSFFVGRISTLEEGRLVFYDFHPVGNDQSIIGTLLSLEDKLSQRISLQLSLISLGTMILVLIFVARIGFTVIYPVTKLAQSTVDIVSGRYDEVSIPEVGKRKDEVAILCRSFGNMVKGLQEREKIRGVLDKVVSKDVADEILRTQIHLGGEDRVVSMFFSDIRGFTHITENLTPQKTIEFLNTCMTKISRVIEGEGGVIDKYVGDEVMALYGAPTVHPDHALRAVSAGLLVIETLKKWNEERVANQLPPIEMGIGVHTGLVVAGNMGAEDRLNYTVLGANVNIAARLCEVAKANQLIISENTLSEPNIEASFYTNPLPPITLKGFTESIKIFEVVGFKWEET